MALETLIGSVISIELTEEVKPAIKISFVECPTENQYLNIFMDFEKFLEDETKSQIVADVGGGRGLYNLPVISYRKSGQPAFEGCCMQGAFSNAIEIRPLSIRDSKLMSGYADHLRKILRVSD